MLVPHESEGIVKRNKPLPDATMSDVRIVHDKVGAYADWRVINGILPYGDRKERYLLGKTEPSFPLPATVDNGETAGNYLNLALCPLYYTGKQSVPCPVCIDRFLDSVEDCLR